MCAESDGRRDQARLSGDDRWVLWHDLMECAGVPDWRPLRLRRVFRIYSHFPWVERRVQIDVDARVPLAQLKSSLDRLWPDLRDEGWVEQTRKLGERALSLAQHVCLDCPRESTWPERLALWNDKQDQDHSKWRFKDVRTFVAAVRRVERHLTGREYGLAWFYDSDAEHDAFTLASPDTLRTLPPAKQVHAYKLRRASIDLVDEADDERILYNLADVRRLADELGYPKTLSPEDREAEESMLRSVYRKLGWTEERIDAAVALIEDEMLPPVPEHLAERPLPRTDLGEWAWYTDSGRAEQSVSILDDTQERILQRLLKRRNDR